MDLSTIKNKVGTYEGYIKQLKDFVDNDKAEELIDELSTNDQRRVDLIHMKEEIKKLKKEVGQHKVGKLQ